MTDFDDAEMLAHGPHDHPAIATLAGCAVLVLAVILVPRLVPEQPLAAMLAGGAALGATLWLIGLVATIRLSSWGWKLGSLAILAGAGAAAGYIAHGQYQARARIDASSFAEVEFGPGGAPVVPGDAAARGPVSRLFAASMRANAQERRDYDGALGKLGLGNLTSPYLLEQDPAALGKCAAIDGVKPMAQEHSRLRAERQAALDRAIVSSSLPADTREGIAMMAAAPGNSDAVLANQLAMLDATRELCTLLAARGWYNQGGVFGFRSGGDMARFDALAARRRTLASEAEQIDRAAAARMKQGQELVRAALS